jgi:hypothetical protein
MLDRSRRTGPVGHPQLPLRGAYACRPRCIYPRDNPVFDMLPFKFRSVSFWNARRVLLTPGCRNEASVSRFSVQKRFGRCASVIVSSAATSNMRRPGGIGPCRSDMIAIPPLRTNARRSLICARVGGASSTRATALMGVAAHLDQAAVGVFDPFARTGMPAGRSFRASPCSVDRGSIRTLSARNPSPNTVTPCFSCPMECKRSHPCSPQGD